MFGASRATTPNRLNRTRRPSR